MLSICWASSLAVLMILGFVDLLSLYLLVFIISQLRKNCTQLEGSLCCPCDGRITTSAHDSRVRGLVVTLINSSSYYYSSNNK